MISFLFFGVLTAQAQETAPASATVPQPPIIVESKVRRAPPPGSLWSETSALQLLGLEGNARQVGDLITVNILEETATKVGSETSTGRQNATNLGVGALLGLETSILKANPNMGESISIDLSSERKFSGSGSTARGSEVSATITCEVLQVLDNGNLKIWGWKEVRVNRETQYVVLQGIVRPRDIQMDNTVTSDLLAQAQIEITGRGVVADREGPGIGTRILDKVWPF
jgi:flagellar L-ring protein precursor FlgH